MIVRRFSRYVGRVCAFTDKRFLFAFETSMKLIALSLIASLTASASTFAQCTSCAMPPAQTFAVASPVVMQTVPVRDGWYPGKWMGEFLFGPRTVTTTSAFVPTTQTVGFAPAVQTVGFAPTMQTVGFAPAAAHMTAYAPTYPPSYLPQVTAYAPTSYVAAYPAMQTIQSQVALAPACDACSTSYRPVTMEPVTACDSCSSCGGCSACSGVATAGYETAVAPSCPSCAAQSQYIEQAPAAAPTADYQYQYQAEPQPAVPSDLPETDRSLLQKPVVDQPAEEAGSEAEEAATESSFFQAPQLFAPKDRVTQRTIGAPVRRAVYSSSVKGATIRTAKPKAVGGWVSAE